MGVCKTTVTTESGASPGFEVAPEYLTSEMARLESAAEDSISRRGFISIPKASKRNASTNASTNTVTSLGHGLGKCIY